MASHRLIVLHARSGGTLYRQVSKRLTVADHARTFLALGSDQLVPARVAGSLRQQGAIGWFVASSAGDERETTRFPMQGQVVGHPAPIISSENCNDEFLTHCTHRAKGAWPNQADEEFLAELIFGEPKRDRSSLTALMRIVGMRKLSASGASIRSGAKVVSFSAASTQDISGKREFRAHRSRWDFEPYEICVDRKIL